LFLAAPACLFAQEFYWTAGSARSGALGGVYLPSSTGVTDALSTNPAGLTALSGRTMDLSLTSVFSWGSFSNSVNANTPLRNGAGLVPYGAFGMPIGWSRFSFGAGVVPELASLSNWNYRDAPGVGGASYGVQRQKSEIVALRSAAGVGFALNRRISLGFSAGAVYNSNTLDAPYVFQSHPVLAGLKTLLNLHTNGVGWNWSAGVLARPVDRVQFSFAWKSQTAVDSTGDATGNLSNQFAALGLNARPDFHYHALVHNVLPSSVLAGASWRVNARWVLALQGNAVNWHSAFASLPVSLSGGNNADINGLLHSSSIFDRVPLQWKNQYSVHAGVERLLTEHVSLRGGFAHANNPVPGSTLSPLTAAIMRDRISTGVGYRAGRWRFDAAYSIAPTAEERSGQSALLSGEYRNSRVRIGIQSVTLNTAFVF
jgi:long-subunit fatty acid transport protein